MYLIRWNACSALLLAGTIICSSAVFALDIEPGVGVGMEYTDNAALTPANEQSDLIAIGYVGARIEESSGPLQADVTTSLNHHHYTQNTFSNQNYFNLGATAGWEMVRDRLDWQLQNFFTQRSVNSVGSDTPDNTQNTNVFTFGLNTVFPLSDRQTFTLLPLYKNFYYEVQDTDNQRYELQANWFYQMYRLTSVGLDGGVSKIEYDSARIPDYTFTRIHGVVSGKRSHSEFDINFGYTYVDREQFDSGGGFTGDLTWLVNLTGHSQLRTFIASELTDSSQGSLNSSVNPENGDPSDQQISGDVLRNSIIALRYLRGDATLNLSLWGELRYQKYAEAPLDRETQTVGAEVNYPVTALLSSGIYGRYIRTKLTDVSRLDKEYAVGGNLSYQLSRKLRSVLDLRYRKKDSTQSGAEYNEMSAFLSLTYGFGQVSRSGGGGG